MTELLLHGKPVPTIFNLLGEKENDMTYALAWGMAQSETFLIELIARITERKLSPAELQINLQKHDAEGGFTDIEVMSGQDLHLIIEAKRGWDLPTKQQLDRYAQRFAHRPTTDNRMIVLTQTRCGTPRCLQA